MQDELKRSIDKLVIPGQEKPYFIEYEMMDTQGVSINAAFGGIMFSQPSRARVATVEVRVGGYDFDNEPGGYPMQVAIEDDYNSLRHELWLATDSAYRAAVEQIARKRAFLKNRVDEEKIPDFSKEEAMNLILPKPEFKFDQAQLEKTIRELSAIFRQYPNIKQSGVNLQAQLVNRYLINSEGTKIRRPFVMITIEAQRLRPGLRWNVGWTFHSVLCDEFRAITFDGSNDEIHSADGGASHEIAIGSGVE